MRKGQDLKTAWINSPQADAVAGYYVQGHTVKQTAEKFGVTIHQVNSVAKKRRLTNGRAWGRISDERKEKIRTEAEERLSLLVASKGFDYLEGYEDKNSSVKIKCQQCGKEFNRTVDFLRKGNVTCHFCEHEKALEKQRKKRELARQQAEVRRVEREWHRLTHPKKDDRREKLLDKTGICEVCGKEYTVREYVESCGLKYARDSNVCSAECRSKKTKQAIKISHKGRRDSHRHRARKFGCDYDPSITLKKLVKRDGLQCSICGGLCDWNDHSWSKYSGPTYPSIDHIIPMSKGGGHTWNNVQVAHILCNSYKCDNMVVKE